MRQIWIKISIITCLKDTFEKVATVTLFLPTAIPIPTTSSTKFVWSIQYLLCIAGPQLRRNTNKSILQAREQGSFEVFAKLHSRQSSKGLERESRGTSYAALLLVGSTVSSKFFTQRGEALASTSSLATARASVLAAILTYEVSIFRATYLASTSTHFDSESPVVEDELGGLSICEADAGYLYFVWLALCSQGHIIIIHRHDDTVFERPIARTPWRKTEDEMPKSKQRSIASGNTHRTCICA
ncbi:hypothetical protein KCU67_g20, partial [Aureobasidium melanogenum]